MWKRYKPALSSRQNRCCDCLAYISLAVVFLALLIRSRYSFCQTDEAFYLSAVNRLWQGDSLFADEWHPASLYTPILLPLYSLYRLLVPDGTGILLFFRVCYVCLAGIVSLLLYRRLRGYGWFPSLASSILCMIYARANIQGISYYNLALLSCLTAGMAVFPLKRKPGKIRLVVGGICIAIAVLCTPYLAIPAIGICVAGLISHKYRKQTVWFALGIALSAAVYLSFVFSGCSVSEMLNGVKYMLNDPQHVETLSEIKKNSLKQWRTMCSDWRAAVPAAFGVLYFLCESIARFRRAVKPLLSVYSIAVLALVAAEALRSRNHICFLTTLWLSVLSIPYVVHLACKKEHWGIVKLYLAGWCLGLGFFLSSNTRLDAMTVEMVISCMASFFAMYHFGRYSAGTLLCGLLKGISIAIVICVLMVCMLQRFVGVYRDADIRKLNTELTTGVASGLYTTRDHASQYEKVCDDLARIQALYPNRGVLVSRRLPWVYFAQDWAAEAPSTWTMDISDPRIEAWIGSHENEFPVVIVFHPEIGQWQSAVFNNHGKSSVPNENEMTGWLWERIQGEDFEVVHLDTCDVYAKREDGK